MLDRARTNSETVQHAFSWRPNCDKTPHSTASRRCSVYGCAYALMHVLTLFQAPRQHLDRAGASPESCCADTPSNTTDASQPQTPISTRQVGGTGETRGYAVRKKRLYTRANPENDSLVESILFSCPQRGKFKYFAPISAPRTAYMTF